ncbi:ring-cleaving dioxygenase [Deinococcus sonorensis]|uniref:Ring-cleaving dioxygenase n=2 Tax=Deinococcus sonorensis TaxID=309891 RepID=A0AAU7U7S0_9DEIO
MKLTGIHHVSSLTAHIDRNHRFYTGVLGMRLVKKTVNQDSPTMYHLFYADAAGSPGTDLTFFDLPHAARQHRGNNEISRTSLRVASESSLPWWAERLQAAGAAVQPVREEYGRPVLNFEDPEGQRLALVPDGGRGPGEVWAGSPVPAEHQIRGLGPVHLTVPDPAPTRDALIRVLQLQEAGSYPDPDSPEHEVRVFQAGEGGADAELHVHIRPDLPRARQGAGAVHHVALRIPDEAQYHAWTARLDALGLQTSGEVDRHWFRSLYWRGPDGILYELATDGPGFATDEDAAHLGERLVLAPFLEPQRARIEAALTPLEVTT